MGYKYASISSLSFVLYLARHSKLLSLLTHRSTAFPLWDTAPPSKSTIMTPLQSLSYSAHLRSHIGAWASSPKQVTSTSSQNDLVLEPHPLQHMMSSRDTASLLASSPSNSPDASLLPMERWMAEMPHDEPWCASQSARKAPSARHDDDQHAAPRRSRARTTRNTSAARAESPQPRCGG
jgi:hypothetical protein